MTRNECESLINSILEGSVQSNADWMSVLTNIEKKRNTNWFFENSIVKCDVYEKIDKKIKNWFIKNAKDMEHSHRDLSLDWMNIHHNLNVTTLGDYLKMKRKSEDKKHAEWSDILKFNRYENLTYLMRCWVELWLKSEDLKLNECQASHIEKMMKEIKSKMHLLNNKKDINGLKECLESIFWIQDQIEETDDLCSRWKNFNPKIFAMIEWITFKNEATQIKAELKKEYCYEIKRI